MLPTLNHEVFKSAYIGICFMTLYSGFYTISNLEKLFLVSNQRDNPLFKGDGYVSQAILYSATSVFMWVVPSIISLVGPKVTLIIGSVGYSLFIASFLSESTWTLYAASALCGVGASMIWTTQGNYMTLISSGTTITRNMAVFSIIMQSAMFYGNIFVYVMFQGKEQLDRETRTQVVVLLLCISMASSWFMMLLPSATDKDGNRIAENHGRPMTALKRTWEIATTKHMLVLFSTFLYMGLQICFMVGVYGSCVGFTKRVEHSQQLVPFVALIIGVGEVISEVSLILFGTKITVWKWGQTTVMIVALIVEYVAFTLVLLNFPNNAVFGDTDDPAFISSSLVMAVIAALLIGVSDGIYMSMVPAMVGILFPNDSVYSYAMFNFVCGFSTALGFFFSNYLGLHWQLAVLTVSATAGALCYIYVSLNIYSKRKPEDQQLIQNHHNKTKHYC